MKNENAAHFDMVKIQNRKMIRNLLRRESPQSIAQLAEKAALSYPTVSSLLKELLKSNEVLLCAETESCGGRPGIRYELNGEYQHAMVMYFEDWTLQGAVYDAYGNLIARMQLQVTENIQPEDIMDFVKERKIKYPTLAAIALGIPGVVKGTEIRYLPKFPALQGCELADMLIETFEADVYIENDINAMVLAEINERSDFAHIVYVNDCIGVGIALNGEVVKGDHGYAGELEYLCSDLKNKEKTFAESILAIMCVLDLSLFYISEENCTEKTVEKIQEILLKTLPEERMPDIHIAAEMGKRYEWGLLQRILLTWAESV